MKEKKINKSWLDMKSKKIAEYLGLKKKQLKKCFPGPFDYAAIARRTASPYKRKGKKGVLAWDGFEDEQFIYFVNSKTGKRNILVSVLDEDEAKKQWKKLVAKQKKRGKQKKQGKKSKKK